MENIGKLTNLQLELIKLFRYDLNENQILEIKDLLIQYFANKVSNEMDRLWNENNWTNDTMKNWSQEHLRAK